MLPLWSALLDGSFVGAFILFLVFPLFWVLQFFFMIGKVSSINMCLFMSNILVMFNSNNDTESDSVDILVIFHIE